MAKGKNANPADAHRKAMRQKELKKNKEERKKVRETVTLKKDIGPLEAEVRRMAEADKARTLDKNGKTRLTELQEELDRIKKTKEEYVALHPEHRHLVYAAEERERLRREALVKEREEGGGPGGGFGGKGRYDEKGRLRDPKRSVYYDPVLNPFGAPPPGMPYRERPLRPDEMMQQQAMNEDEDEDEDEEDEDSDDDIIMPEGPPPDRPDPEQDGNASDSDESIVMPEGSPPPEARMYTVEAPKDPATDRTAMTAGRFPPGFRPPPPLHFGFRPPPPMMMMQNQRGNFPAVPMNGAFPPRPPHGYPPPQQQQQHFPPPPPGFFMQNGPGQHPMNMGRPPARPYGGRGPASAVADPLSDTPHQTFQAHQQARRADRIAGAQEEKETGGTPHPLPDKPEGSSAPAKRPEAPAVISAAPQLIDYRKDVAAFVPRGVKKKKAAEIAAAAAAPAMPSMEPGSSGSMTTAMPTGPAPIVVNAAPVINAAPGVEDSDSDSDGGYVLPSAATAVRPKKQAAPPVVAYNPAGGGFGGGLLGKLSSVLGNGAEMKAEPAKPEAPRPGDDYKDFLAGLEKLS